MKIYNHLGNPVFTIRFADEKDASIILKFIKELALYEHLSDAVTATEERILTSIFVNKQAEVILGEENGIPVGFALFFHNYSTFLGKANLFLEDLFVNETHRGKGYGKALLSYVAKLALSRDCERLDWLCLDWNQSSIEFYKEVGAENLHNWTLFRSQGKNLNMLAELI
jgi:GNAT superfamily N-acetyltransferase